MTGELGRGGRTWRGQPRKGEERRRDDWRAKENTGPEERELERRGENERRDPPPADLVPPMLTPWLRP